MRNVGCRNVDSGQFFLPFDAGFSGALAPGARKPQAAARLSQVGVPQKSSIPDEQSEYRIGVSMVWKGRPSVTFDCSNRFGVLDLLAPHIGRRSALLLEMLGYRTITDLARTGCYLSAIPSIGPKKTEKILNVVEGFGFSPPRRAAPVSRPWRAIFDHLGQ